METLCPKFLLPGGFALGIFVAACEIDYLYGTMVIIVPASGSSIPYKGALLNNLSDSNVETITGEISTIFESVGRITGCQIIGEEVLISSRETHLKEQHAALYAAFVAGMASLVGIDFSAKLIAALAKAFEDLYRVQLETFWRKLTL